MSAGLDSVAAPSVAWRSTWTQLSVAFETGGSPPRSLHDRLEPAVRSHCSPSSRVLWSDVAPGVFDTRGERGAWPGHHPPHRRAAARRSRRRCATDELGQNSRGSTCSTAVLGDVARAWALTEIQRIAQQHEMLEPHGSIEIEAESTRMGFEVGAATSSRPSPRARPPSIPPR